MGKNKQLIKAIEKQNDFLFNKLESQNESIKYTIETLMDDYAKNCMMMHMLVGKISPAKKLSTKL